MFEGISAKILLSAGPWGLLILVVTAVVIALMTGRIVPRKTVDENYRILNERIVQAEKREAIWQAVAETWRATTHEAVANRESQEEQGRTLIQMLSSIPRGPGRRGGA